jgi:hypothetical protein
VSNADLLGHCAHFRQTASEGVSPEIKNNIVTVQGSKRSEVGSERYTRELGAPQGRA